MGKLVWLASYPKSGNTWLRAFLHNYLMAPSGSYDINRLGDLTTGESGASLYRRHDPRPASRYSAADVRRMRPLVHRDIMGADGERVFVKTHNARLLIDGVPLVTPAVTDRAIYVVRDPRDVAISYSRYLGLTLDAMIGLMANPDAVSGGDDRKVIEHIASWSVHVESWTHDPNPRLLVLRYEDMLADPADCFGDVIRSLGAEPDPVRLERAIGFSSFDALRGQEEATGFIERPPGVTSAFFRDGRAGQWREVLKPAQRERIEHAFEGQMRRFDYL